MRHREPIVHWTSTDRWRCGLLSAAAVFLGYASVTYSLAQFLTESNPELAHRLAPYDGRVSARLAASLAGPDAKASDRVRSDALARRALGDDPTVVMAVATLGINAHARGDVATARRLFAYSQRLSRRDLQTQLWAIEDAVGRGEIVEALQHYNVALRVWPDSSELLFPVLASASTEPEIRRALIRTLAEKPSWSNSFVNYLASNGPDPQVAAQMFSDLARVGGFVPDYARAGVINALIVRGMPDKAWAYYASSHVADRRRSRDPRFTANLQTPSQLDWLPASGGDIITSIHSGIFEFSAPSGIGGPLIQQVQFLPPGDYVLSGHSSGIDLGDETHPYWVLKCQDGRELGRAVLPNSVQLNGNFSGRFSVPVTCSLQTLALVARPSDAAGGIAGQINWVQLAPEE